MRSRESGLTALELAVVAGFLAVGIITLVWALQNTANSSSNEMSQFKSIKLSQERLNGKPGTKDHTMVYTVAFERVCKDGEKVVAPTGDDASNNFWKDQIGKNDIVTGYFQSDSGLNSWRMEFVRGGAWVWDDVEKQAKRLNEALAAAGNKGPCRQVAAAG